MEGTVAMTAAITIPAEKKRKDLDAIVAGLKLTGWNAATSMSMNQMVQQVQNRPQAMELFKYVLERTTIHVTCPVCGKVQVAGWNPDTKEVRFEAHRAPGLALGANCKGSAQVYQGEEA